VQVERPPLDDVGTFFAAIGTALRDTVLRLEHTVARVTDMAAKLPGRADRDMVVTLQEFDRLHQELIAFADVFDEAASKSHESWVRTSDDHPAEDMLSIIQIADLQDRLRRHLGRSMFDLVPPPESERMEF
jgi:hypothetical protein